MPRLRLDGSGYTFDLGGISGAGYGVSALEGVNGLGLPDLTTQWASGAGDGAVFRGTRVPARDIDIPVFIQAPSHAALRASMGQAARMLAGPMVLTFVEDDGTSWFLNVRRVGGGNFALGPDTQATDWLHAVVTLRAGDPYWTSNAVQSVTIKPTGGRGLLKSGAASLLALQVSAASTLGSVSMENQGDADAYPVWTITGPGSNFVATSPTGESFTWTGSLAAGESLTINTKTGAVVDGTGANRYGSLATAPRFWRIPPGVSVATIELDDTTTASQIAVAWQARKWSVL